MQQPSFHFDPREQVIKVRFADGHELLVNRDALSVSYFSSGHGGQNVNKHMNGVRLIYRIPEIFRRPAFKTQELIARSIRQRHREQNFKEAFEILFQKIRQYFYVRPFRKKTKASRASNEKRLEGKHIQSMKKRIRSLEQRDF